MVTKHQLEQVFGVRAEKVLSYIDRPAVDSRFQEGLSSDKQIIVYGASKQGKTSLVANYLPYNENVVVRVGPKTQIADIYASILRAIGVKLAVSSTETAGKEANIGTGATFKASIPLWGSASAKVDAGLKDTSGNGTSYEEIRFNLELAQDISEILTRMGFARTIIIENFHYLDDEKQAQFAFDLRTFQETGIRFVILGVWRERNRLIQFNGDLLDRVIEVPVEPWEEKDFKRVALAGGDALNIAFAPSLLEPIVNASFSSIGVFQELLKKTCVAAGITETQDNHTTLNELKHFEIAIKEKANDYTSRHQRSLESIAAGNLSTSMKDGKVPLFLPYYLVKVLLDGGFDAISNGMRRATLTEKIQAMHHRSQDVRASDMSNLLYTLAVLQTNKGISPPLFDYDKTGKHLQVVDSTFYFFLKNADLKEISAEIPSPLER